MKNKQTFKEFRMIPGDHCHVKCDDYEFTFDSHSLCKVIILEYGQVDLNTDDELLF